MTARQPTGLFRHQVTRETDKALCFRLDNSGGATRFVKDRTGDFWFPKSQVEWRSSVYGDELCAPAWLLRQKFQ
jgi:hypothetical protein